MLDNTIITKFELSEREKVLKKQFFKREEEPGKKYLFIRQNEKNNDSNNNKSNLNNSHSLSLEQNLNQSNNLKRNTFYNEKILNNASNNNIKSISQNPNISSKIPDIKDITNEEMNKFFEDGANYLPKTNGGMSPDQMNLLMHQYKIMQRNVDVLQETNRSLQDFIIYTMKKDSEKNNLKEEEKIQEQDRSNMEYNKLNEALSPLYTHINNLQSQVKELNQKKREEEIKVELDDLIIKSQKDFKPKNPPFFKSRQTNLEEEKSNKKMMKTLSSLKGTMSNLSEEMRKIGSTFNEKMRKVMEDTEKNKLTNIIGMRSNSSINNKKMLGNRNFKKDQSYNISTFKENLNQNESIVKNNLDEMDYNSLKSELIDIGKKQESIVNDYKSTAPEFIELKKPKTKIKFNYNVDSELDKIETKINNKKSSKSKPIINIDSEKKKNDSQLKEKVTDIVSKEKKKKNSSVNIPKKEREKPVSFSDKKGKIYINNNNKEIDNKEHEDKMKEINQLSLVERMNLYKEKMAQQAKNINIQEEKIEDNKRNQNKNEFIPKNDNMNPQNDIGSNHSGITFQTFQKNKTKQIKQNNNIEYNPPKVKYTQFSGQNDYPDLNNKGRYNPQQIKNSNNIIPDQDNLNNMIKNKIDNYLAAAFNNLNPSEAPKFNLNNEKSPQKNEIQRVYEKEYIINKIKEVQNIPQQPVNQQSQNQEQNNKLMEKFTNLAEKFTNLEEKISKQIYEEKNSLEKKIDILKEKEKEIQKEINIVPQVIHQPPPQKKLILPDIEEITKLVVDKMSLEEEEKINIKNKKKKKKPKKKEEIKPKEEEKKEEKIDTFDINQNIKMDELDDMIRMPHKINLAEYEVSQTSSYLSESLQNNNFNFNNMNNNNQININKLKINIKENENISEYDETKIDNNININNSKSNGEVDSNEENSSHNNNINNITNPFNINNMKNKNGIDLLTIKNTNEELQDNINILNNNIEQNNINNIQKNNKYQDFKKYLNNFNFNDSKNNEDDDGFFKDSGEIN